MKPIAIQAIIGRNTSKSVDIRLPAPTGPSVFVFDLDGTLSNDSHRKKWADAARHLAVVNGLNQKDLDYIRHCWDTYNSLSALDEPNQEIKNMISSIANSNISTEIWILTARPVEYLLLTTDWLAKHLGMGLLGDISRVIMRPTGNFDTAANFKRKVLEHFSSEVRFIIFVDDNEQVIEAVSHLCQSTYHYKQP